jgi:hypothetical protein
VYAKYTLLTALDASPQHAQLPDVMSLHDVEGAAVAGQNLGENGFPSGTLFVVDLRGAASVAFGVALSRASHQPVSLVPTFNNWPGVDELVPAEETLAALATMAPRPQATASGPTTPVLLLDSWRLAYRYEDPGEGTYDNRYILTPTDLPEVEALRARGVERVVYVVESLDETLFEEDDVHASFLAYQGAGLPIAMVDLGRLEGPLDAHGWAQLLSECALVVQPRTTILDDPGFYVLARGGFGGIYAGPSPFYGGGVWIVGGTYARYGGGWHGGGG